MRFGLRPRGRDQKADPRPSPPGQMREREAVHRAPYVNVREQRADVSSVIAYKHARAIRVVGVYDAEPRLGQRCADCHTDEELVLQNDDDVSHPRRGPSNLS